MQITLFLEGLVRARVNMEPTVAFKVKKPIFFGKQSWQIRRVPASTEVLKFFMTALHFDYWSGWTIMGEVDKPLDAPCNAFVHNIMNKILTYKHTTKVCRP